MGRSDEDRASLATFEPIDTQATGVDGNPQHLQPDVLNVRALIRVPGSSTATERTPCSRRHATGQPDALRRAVREDDSIRREPHRGRCAVQIRRQGRAQPAFRARSPA